MSEDSEISNLKEELQTNSVRESEIAVREGIKTYYS